jgi:hypothetical protein
MVSTDLEHNCNCRAVDGKGNESRSRAANPRKDSADESTNEKASRLSPDAVPIIDSIDEFA